MASPAAENVLLLSTLSILQIIKEAQQQHGLRHGDYQRYRGYCARRLRRIRKSLHSTNVHKQKSNFQPRPVTIENVVGDSRYLLIFLFEAERCWAFSMQLKQEANTEPRKKFHLINRLKRAVKHSQILENFCKQNESNVDAATKLEAQAYNSWMHGCLQFELADWQKAKEHFSTAKTIYDKLSSISDQQQQLQHKISSAPTGGSTLDLYQQRCQDTIAPQLRYCAFKIGDESAAADLVEMRMHMAGDQENLAVSDIDKLIAQTREKQVAEMKSELTWCNYKINISKQSNNKIKSFYANLKQFDEQLTQAESQDAKLSLYEQLLIDCRDAIQAVRDENKNENFKIKRPTQNDDSSSSAGGENLHNLTAPQILYSWLTFTRLTKTVDKYLLMIKHQQNQSIKSDKNLHKPDGETGFSAAAGGNGTESKKPVLTTTTTMKTGLTAKPQDLVRLYDAVLQNLNEIQQLTGVQNDPAFLALVEARIAYYTTFRCFYVAEVFAAHKKWREALALYDRCSDYGKRAKKLVSGVKNLHQTDLNIDSLNDLFNTVNAAKYVSHANSVADDKQQSIDNNINQLIKGVSDKLYVEDFETYRRLNPQDVLGAKRTVQVTRMPPDFRPMPCKPLFFDLALNHIRFPNLESKLDTTDLQQRPSSATGTAADDGTESPEKSGLSGLVKGWFWGSKK